MSWTISSCKLLLLKLQFFEFKYAIHIYKEQYWTQYCTLRCTKLNTLESDQSDITRNPWLWVMKNTWFLKRSYFIFKNYRYILWTLERLVTDDYVLVYLHSGATRLPSFGWMKRCYQMVGRKLRKNLSHLYIVHPTFLIKTMLFMAKPFIR